MSEKKSSKEILRIFFLVFTSICTILSFMNIIWGSDKWTEFVAYYFLLFFAAFLVIVLLLLGMFLFKLEPGIKDGRYLLLIIPTLCFIGSAYLYFKESNPSNRWGLIFMTVGLCIAVIIIVLTLFSWSARSFTSSEDKDFIVNSVSSKLVRMNNHLYEFDVYKDIQSRVPVLTVMDTRFKWTGDKVDPDKVTVSSVTHNVQKIKVDDEGYDTLKLLFRAPLYYKQAFTCHYKLSNLTDNETPAEQYLSQMVKSNETISLVCFDVILKDVDSNYRKDALVQRKKASAPPGAKYQDIDKAPFDAATKSYHYDLFNPDSGYDYRLYWGNK